MSCSEKNRYALLTPSSSTMYSFIACSRFCLSDLAKAGCQFPSRETELLTHVHGGRQVLSELLLQQTGAQIDAVRNEGTLALAGHDDALTLELEIGALDGDDADAGRHG